MMLLFMEKAKLAASSKTPSTMNVMPIEGMTRSESFNFLFIIPTIFKYFLQKYKKYLVNSRKSCNFAPHFVEMACLRTHSPVLQENFNINI